MIPQNVCTSYEEAGLLLVDVDYIIKTIVLILLFIKHS